MLSLSPLAQYQCMWCHQFYIFLLIIEINNVKESPVIILDAASFTSVRVQPLVLSRDLIGPGYLAASYL